SFSRFQPYFILSSGSSLICLAAQRRWPVRSRLAASRGGRTWVGLRVGCCFVDCLCAGVANGNRMNMGSNGRGNRDLVRRKENENGYFLAVFHALSFAADHQTEIVGSVAQSHDCSDRARTKIALRSSRAPAGDDEPARLSDIPLH